MIKIKVKKDRDGDDSLSSDWKTKIEDADELAKSYIDALQEDLDVIFDQPGKGRDRKDKRVAAWKANAKITKWLGSEKVTNEEIVDVRRRVRKVGNKLGRGSKYFVIKEQTGLKSHGCGKGTNAYVRPVLHEKRVHLCPRWFTEKDADEQAAIIVHEVVHKLGLFKTHHGATTKSEARTLATDHPKRSRKSPENYEHLVLEY